MSSNTNDTAKIDELISKPDVLKLAYDTQVKWVDYHNELTHRIFSWSTSLLLAIITLLAALGPKISDIHRWILTIAILIVTAFVYNWQRTNGAEKKEHIDNLCFIDDLFHLREPGYYGGSRGVYEKIRHAEKFLDLNAFHITLFLLAVLTLAMIWTI